ncbi:pyrroline-5-carboxylate reductase, partial [Syncephalis fuscata]
EQAVQSQTTTAESSQPARIAFIGGGNMAEAIIAGLLHTGHPIDRLNVSEPMAARRDYLIQRYPALAPRITDDNSKAANDANVVVLAVKPSVVPIVLDGLREQLFATGAVILSIAAGVRLSDMTRWLTETASHDDLKSWQPPIVRCMPNTPALVGHGAAGVYANPAVSPKQRASVANVLDAVSETVCWVDTESQIDAVTAVSGSGPAYFFLLLEAMVDAGVKAGLSPEVAAQLSAQTCLGAAHMAMKTTDTFAELREKVTSPNGTTYAAITHMEQGGVPECLRAAVQLGEELGQAKI